MYHVIIVQPTTDDKRLENVKFIPVVYLQLEGQTK